MIAFWAVAGVLAAASAGLVLFRAAAVRDAAVDPMRELYRRQLAEIGELADRGLIAPDERRGAEAEAGRRLLRAADAPQEAWTSGPRGRAPVAISIVAATAAALAIYAAAGSPGMPDRPFAARLATWRSEDPALLTPPELTAVLSGLARERPDDPEAQRFLAIAAGAARDPAVAVRAMRRAVSLAPQRADLWELLGQALMAQAGGEVSPAARNAFREAVKRDPSTAAARFYLARAQAEAGDKAGAIVAWRGLAADLPPADPRREAVLAAMAEAQSGAVQAPAEGQLAMIRGMVEGLAQRLTANPDDPQGWVRLVRAYAVLGETSKRDEALRAARARYGANPELLSQLAAAAQAEPMR